MNFELGPGIAYNQPVPDAFARPIDANTRSCAVLGHPIQHSASPALQNAGLAALGLNWRYLAFDVRPEELRETIAGAKAMRFIGLNLTVPHKVLAVDLVDAIDDRARRYGAVNTIRFEARTENGEWVPLQQWGAPPSGGAAPQPRPPEGGTPKPRPGEVRSHGFNTDAEGFALSLREEFPALNLAGARVALLGTGGAGRTLALRLAQEGVGAMSLIDIDARRAEQVAGEVRSSFPGVQVIPGYLAKDDADLLINATPLGLRPDDPLPLNEQRLALRRIRFVYDLVYRPAETPLLRQAKAAGCHAANGLGMLLHQGAAALELWSGQPAPVAVMRRALERNVYGH